MLSYFPGLPAIALPSPYYSILTLEASSGNNQLNQLDLGFFLPLPPASLALLTSPLP